MTERAQSIVGAKIVKVVYEDHTNAEGKRCNEAGKEIWFPREMLGVDSRRRTACLECGEWAIVSLIS